MNLESLKSIIRKYPIGAGALTVGLIVLVALVVRYLDVASIQEKHSGAAAEFQRITENISRAGQLTEQMQILEEGNKVIAGRLVNPTDLAINLQYFYKLEAESGVKLLDTRPVDVRTGAKAVKGTYTSVQYVVSMQGSYGRILSFLRKLEHGTHFCRIISSNCNSAVADQGRQGGEKGSADMVMSLTVELLGKS